MSTTVRPQQLRIQFFGFLFGDQKGYLCIAYADKSKSAFRQKFFEWPIDSQAVANFIEQIQEKHNVWFCVSLLSATERAKQYCLPSSIVWADLDEVDPSNIELTPTISIESSPNRYHGYWRLENTVPADVAEDFSRRLAYKVGADKSGWDMVQLLRVPWTNNLKYDPPAPVQLISIEELVYSIDTFDALPMDYPQEPGNEVNPTTGGQLRGMPNVDEMPTTEMVLYRYKSENKLTEEFLTLYNRVPSEQEDWSRILWRFLNHCAEIGLKQEETFSVAITAGCNKYARENRPISHLWREVTKAYDNREIVRTTVGASRVPTMPILVDPDSIVEDAFIHEYKTWASQATDAPEQYHELTCFIALSAVVSSGLWLAVDWGEIVPNLWGLLLGESTLTRKTTAMRLAVDMLKDIDDSLILATDGSAEGLLSGLAQRPKRVSIFWKDEVSGLFDSINRKDYLAGLPETLTQLYDVPKVLTRLLRKETITISEPYFIFFGGGIRDKVYSLLNDEYILSGFLPRFLVVSGENDLSRLRRTGPPSAVSTERKDNVARTLTDLRESYNVSVPMEVFGQQVNLPTRIEARLSDDAWAEFQRIEEILTRTGYECDLPMLGLPLFQRLGFSLLKMALLVAASRREPDSSNRLHVELGDVQQAAFYIQKWGKYSIDLMMNTGKSNHEKILERLIKRVKDNPGVTKSEIMQRMHLSTRDTKDLLDTLQDRGLILVKKAGSGFRIYPQ